MLPYAKVIINKQDAWIYDDISATLIGYTHPHAEQAKSGLTKKDKLAAEEQYHAIKRENDRMTEWPCAVRQTLNMAKQRVLVNSIEQVNPLDKIADIETDFQIWDMEENYTGAHNIKAKKTQPTKPLDLSLIHI